MSDWVGRTATEIAAAVRAGDATAHEVTRAHLDRISAIDGELGAFVRVRADAALDEAAAIDARADRAELPLAGVPIAIKDNVPVAGEPMRRGSAATPDVPQENDHPLVGRLRAAGAVIVGSTNLPELGLYPFTDNVYGMARNPWDTGRTAGGSSGGAAAAVASGMVPIAHGNDGGGSIRIPSANCGLFGIKPGPGLIPREPGENDWGGLSENGPLATTVADAALMLAVMAGEPGLIDIAEPEPVRIGVAANPPTIGMTIAKDFQRTVRATGAELAALGHTVETDDLRVPIWAANAFLVRWLFFPGDDAEPYLADPATSSLLQPRTRRHLRAGRLAAKVRPPKDSDRERLRQAVAPYFARHDVLVTPTTAHPAPRARHGENAWLRSFGTSVRYAPMTGTWNLAGYPAVSVPAGVSERGLPLAVQFVATPGRERLLLELAAQLERRRPWARFAPAYDPQASLV
ncbi:MAG TPA: amidase family protein [Streptosporangiaceae bacterium]|nr:amidase family protein [Streptosporangiaceae bacterium]